MRARALIFAGAVLAVIVAIVAAASLLGGGDSGKGDSGRAVPAADPAFDAAPAPIKSLHEQRSKLLGGGQPAFEKRIAELRGHPVVVNKWASWCGPCRAEFPVFAKAASQQAKKVAFVGVNSMDYDGDALKFLRREPLPYPSYRDPDVKIARSFNAPAAWPSTAFYDAKGKLQYTHQGPYRTVEDLLADIEKYT